MPARARALFSSLASRLRLRLAAERGSIMVLSALVMVVAVGATAIAVDIGHGVSHKRDLQSDADLGALDAVRALGDRATQRGEMGIQQFAEKLAQESLERNGFDTNAAGNTWSLVLGRFERATWTFTPSDPSIANAVKLNVASPINFAFKAGGSTYSASSIADVGFDSNPDPNPDPDPDPDGDPEDCSETDCPGVGGISLGSWLARLDTSKSTLANGLLSEFLGAGSNLTLDLVSYQGLANASVNLQDLRTALNLTAGTPEQFLDTTVTMRNLLTAMASAMAAQGDTASLAAVTPLATLAAATDNTLDLKLGELINLAQGSGSDALNAGINVFTLASMAAQVADSDHFITLSTPITIPGVTSSTLDLQVIEAPRIAIGPAAMEGGEWVTKVETAQIRARLNLNLTATATLSTLLLGLVQVPVQLPLYIEGAGAEAAITAIDCNLPLDTSTMGVHVDSQALKLQLGAVSLPALQDVNVTVTPTPGTVASVNLLGLGLLSVTGSSTHNSTSTASDMTFTGPWDMSNTQTNNGSTTLGLASGLLVGAGDLNVNLLTINVAALKTSILGVINPVLSILDDGIIDDLLTMLGISLGGADVTAWHLDCPDRSLVG